MQFTQHATPGLNVIRGYREGELKVNDTIHRGTVIVGPNTLMTQPDLGQLDQLITMDVQPILALEPELVLFGTGQKQIFPPPAFGAQFLRAGVGFEVMDTGAASRTYNVLIAEQRQVLAILLT
jgi:uncharacterized protein